MVTDNISQGVHCWFTPEKVDICQVSILSPWVDGCVTSDLCCLNADIQQDEDEECTRKTCRTGSRNTTMESDGILLSATILCSVCANYLVPGLAYVIVCIR